LRRDQFLHNERVRRRIAARQEAAVPSNEFGFSSYAGDPAGEAAERAATLAARAKDKAAEVVDRAKEKASEVAERAAGAVDMRRGSAASTLDSAAKGLHQSADRIPGGPAVSQFAHKTADKIGQTAGYVRDHDVRDMLADVTSYIKAHPAQTLIAVAALGFLAGRAVRRG